MTVIAGIIENGEVFIGADSQLSNNGRRETALHGKVWSRNGMTLAWSGGQREAQLVRYTFEPPAVSEGQNPLAYLCGPFVAALRDLHAEAGTLNRQEGVNRVHQVLLIGWRGRLFAISEYFCVTEYKDCVAEGSGGQVAQAALHALDGLGLPPVERMKRALEAAELMSSGVRGPFTVLSGGDEFGRPRNLL